MAAPRRIGTRIPLIVCMANYVHGARRFTAAGVARGGMLLLY
jgi:hypothetical protein